MSSQVRHVWVRPAYDVGRWRQGLVVTWRSRPTQTSSPVREAFVAIVDEPDEATRFEWVEERHLVPVASPSPDSLR